VVVDCGVETGEHGGTSFDARVFRKMYAEALQCSRRIGMIQR
jgi:hypothetical protein